MGTCRTSIDINIIKDCNYKKITYLTLRALVPSRHSLVETNYALPETLD